MCYRKEKLDRTGIKTKLTMAGYAAGRKQ